MRSSRNKTHGTKRSATWIFFVVCLPLPLLFLLRFPCGELTLEFAPEDTTSVPACCQNGGATCCQCTADALIGCLHCSFPRQHLQYSVQRKCVGSRRRHSSHGVHVSQTTSISGYRCDPLHQEQKAKDQETLSEARHHHQDSHVATLRVPVVMAIKLEGGLNCSARQVHEGERLRVAKYDAEEFPR